MKLFSPSILKYFKPFSFFCSLFFSCFTYAQNKLPGKAIEIVGGYSKNGSGDLNGIVFGTDYINYISRRVSLNY